MSSAPCSFWLGAAADGMVSEGVGSEEVGGMVSERVRSIGIDDPGGVLSLHLQSGHHTPSFLTSPSLALCLHTKGG